MSESNGYVSPVVSDGYTAEFTIPADPAGRWSATLIRYRPWCVEDESLVINNKGLNLDKSFARCYAEHLAGNPEKLQPAKLLGWGVKDADGNPLKITADNLCRTREGFFDALLAAVKTQLEDDLKN